MSDKTVKLQTAANGVQYYTFPTLSETGLVKHAFSTRIGGVSTGMWESLNFSFTMGDDPENVKENYRRMAEAIDVEADSFVLPHQTHTVNIRNVTAADKGKGITKERDYQDTDGFVTDEPGVTLVTMSADCVLLYFLDPVKKVIGLSHSGWAGTAKGMGRETIEKMHRDYGSEPGDLIACIAPSICRDCFEVSEDVRELFASAYPQWADWIIRRRETPGKYDVDLWITNKLLMMRSGVKEGNISIAGICTKCREDLFYSHRRSGKNRGTLAGFLALK